MHLPSYNGALGKTLAKILPDCAWASYLLSCRVFKRTFGWWPSIRHPRSFNEWLFMRKVTLPRRTSFAPWVDKHLVKQFVADEMRGSTAECRVARTLHHATRADDPFFDTIVPRCVIKGTHGSGMTILVQSPRTLTADEKAALKLWMDTDYFTGSREPGYRHLKPAIIAEEFLPSGSLVPEDYKFFCFRGQVAFIQHDTGRYIEHLRCLYTTDWRCLPVSLAHDRYLAPAAAPRDLDVMLEIAQRLSREHDFVRVDLYQTGVGVYFGEMTFFPGSGLEVFTPASFDLAIHERWLRKEPRHESWNLESLLQQPALLS
ncbi:MAG: ATP-grasp fold amidoligase family protein [Verrucomicrobiaceae bacterium]